MTQLTTVDMRVDAATDIVSSVAASPHYVFVGNDWDPDSANALYDSTFWTLVEPYKNMIAGKIVESTDASLMILDVPWSEGTVYSMYDDQDPTLPVSNYYSSTLEGSYTHVWKCLDNDNGSPSTAQPSIGDVAAFDEVYQTSDGYRWKYMYSADSATVTKFSTQGWIPLVPNTSVVQAAAPGVIDIIKVDSPGSGYDNNLSGSFRAQDLRIGGNSAVYSVAANDAASTQAGFYTGCVMYLSSGTGVGQFRRVVDYFSNSSSRYVVLESGFDELPVNGTTWDVTPEVIVVGTGLETQNAYARALVNAVGNSIYRVEVLSRGEGYTYATAGVVANSVVSPSPASVGVISPPRDGHGSHPDVELRATSAAVSVTLSGSESNTIPYQGDFGQVGLLRDPKWSEVVLGVNAQGTFLTDDVITFYERSLLQVNATSNAASRVVDFSSGGIDQQASVGDLLYVVSPDGSEWTFSTVSSVNSTTVTLASNAGFSCTQCYVYSVEETVTGKTTATGGVTSVTADLDASVDEGDLFYTSTAQGAVTSITRGGVAKGFDTFVQATVVTGSYISGALELNERVWAGADSSNAVSEGVVQSIYVDGTIVTLYLTRSRGQFFPAQALKGSSSGAFFQVSSVVPGELQSESAPILHLENVDRVTRSSSERENFRILFQL